MTEVLHAAVNRWWGATLADSVRLTVSWDSRGFTCPSRSSAFLFFSAPNAHRGQMFFFSNVLWKMFFDFPENWATALKGSIIEQLVFEFQVQPSVNWRHNQNPWHWSAAAPLSINQSVQLYNFHLYSANSQPKAFQVLCDGTNWDPRASMVRQWPGKAPFAVVAASDPHPTWSENVAQADLTTGNFVLKLTWPTTQTSVLPALSVRKRFAGDRNYCRFLEASLPVSWKKYIITFTLVLLNKKEAAENKERTQLWLN